MRGYSIIKRTDSHITFFCFQCRSEETIDRNIGKFYSRRKDRPERMSDTPSPNHKESELMDYWVQEHEKSCLATLRMPRNQDPIH